MDQNNPRTHNVNNTQSPGPERIRIIAAAVLLAVAIFIIAVRSCGDSEKKIIPSALSSPFKKGKPKGPADVVRHYSEREFNETLADKETVTASDKSYNVTLTVSPELQRKLYKLMVKYHPRCGAAVVIRPSTGEVLAAVSYRNDKEESFLPESRNMLFWNEYPAASLFKIVTTAGVLEYNLMNTADGINVTGNLWTLYKRQLQQDAPNRWSRLISMREAFTRSINPFFGKVGMYILGPDRLNTTAGKFLFNHPIAFDLPLGASRYVPPNDPYEAAALACGFNSFTTISPIHAAMLAGAVVNNGKVANPKLFREITRDGKAVFNGGVDTMYSLITSATSKETMKVMSEVVKKGTARKGFAHLNRSRSFDNIRMGGKTGNLNSTSPRGRCDWFTGFAYDSRKPSDAIAVAVVTVHGPYWNVHSSYVGAEAINFYFSNR
ncbi:MAG: hypothetical protein JNL74_22920 [Fibrobacteres bacterium]|nr:hypothetical protein [Fibrobacterota bacterium]